jgi:dTDP-4-amino-4,6-dideoxygalactose transaminase
MKVPLLDLKIQYQSIKNEIDPVVSSVVESQYFILGPEVTKFEENMAKYLGCKHVIGVSSGTDALLLALMALDIKPGDEVILPTYSFFATAGVVSRMNAIPVFADIDPVTFNIDTKDIRKKITARTKAIIPVHLYGQSAEMDSIMEISKEFNIPVIEDAAQAIGTQYKDGKMVGTIGQIGCFSFFPSKNLGGFGDAGMVTTNDDNLAYQLRIKRVHGGEKMYYHKVIGGNFRIDALQAAVLSVKLPHLDNWTKGRQKNAEKYFEFLKNSGLCEVEGNLIYSDKNKVLIPKAVYKESGHKNYHIYNQFIIRVQKRDELMDYLKTKDIGCAIYYPVPFHQQECFAYLGCKNEDYPNSNKAALESIALPIYPELTNEQLKYVADSIAEFLNKK